MPEIPLDSIGPAKILQLNDVQTGLRAVIVVDNVALGPAIGGVRFSPHVTPLEVARLARAMTLKSAIAGLDHGGAKAGIIGDPNQPGKQHLAHTFARLMAGVTEYIPGPDMGTDEQFMVWIREEIGRACGVPASLGGLPLDELGATGFGLAACAEVAGAEIGLPLAGARVAVQGFGNVGRAAARFMAELGTALVAASDSHGTIHSPGGLDVGELVAIKRQGGSVVDYSAGTVLPQEKIFACDADILVPAATPDVIDRNNVETVRAKLILQGANIPVTREAEEALARRGVLVIPDFIANAGGLIMAAMEYRKKSAMEAFAMIREKIQENTSRILQRAKREGVSPRQAGEQLALERVREAMAIRDLSRPWR